MREPGSLPRALDAERVLLLVTEDDHRWPGRPRHRRVGDRIRPVDDQEHGLRAGPGAQRGGSRRHHPSQPGNGPSPSPHGRPSFRQSEPSTPRDLALPNVAILEQLVARVVEAGKDQSWGDVVTILATTALRISEESGLRVGEIDLIMGLIHVHRQTYPGHGGLVTKETNGRRRRTVPIIDPLRPTLVQLTPADAQRNDWCSVPAAA